MRFISIALFLASFNFACDSFGSADYYQMVKSLIDGKNDTALSILNHKHCSDTIAWSMARDLVMKNKDPRNVLQWCIQQKCDSKWMYATIPISYVKYASEIDKHKIIQTFYQIMEESSCSNEIKDAILIDLDGLRDK